MRISDWISDVCSSDLAHLIMNKLLAVFPQLAGIRAETAGGGLMGYPRHKMLQIGEVKPGAWYAMGFGGHGMGTTTLAGELVATAIAEGDRRYQLFAPFGLDWAGGAVGRLYRSEEHTSEIQSIMPTSDAVFCSKKNKVTKA